MYANPLVTENYANPFTPCLFSKQVRSLGVEFAVEFISLLASCKYCERLLDALEARCRPSAR